MEIKHTPGPWRIGKTGGAVVADHPTCERKSTGHDDTSYYGGHLVCESVCTQANAKLIASAPELLEALQHCKEWFEKSGGDLSKHLLDKINPIIHKATGK